MRDWLTEEEEEREARNEPWLRLEMMALALGMFAMAFFVLKDLLRGSL